MPCDLGVRNEESRYFWSNMTYRKIYMITMVEMTFRITRKK